MPSASPTLAPTCFIQTNVEVADESTLSAALICAGVGGVIEARLSASLTLSATLSVGVNATLGVDGSAARPTISGGGSVQLFEVSAGATLRLANLTLEGGYKRGFGGAVFIDGEASGARLEATAVRFVDNEAKGVGGAIYFGSGDLILRGCEVSSDVPCKDWLP